VGEDKCILLDTGLLAQRQAIEETLLAHGITPIGILGSHAHTDHSPNHRYFQEKYHIPVALPLGEAGLCTSLLNLKAYFFMITPRQAAEEQDVAQMVLRTDRVITPEEDRITFCGVDFDIIHTPGHSPDHICIRTPDGVLYLGDALLTGEGLRWAKVPYFFSLEEGLRSMEKLRGEEATLYLAAHRGVYPDIEPLVEENIATIQNRAEQIRRLVDHPMTEGELHRRTKEHFKMLTSDLSRAGRYVRDIQNYVEYLRDTGQLRVYAQLGTIYYAPLEEKERTEP
jgi:glyoxylase-like metal-dependent hydrolase (beta-lactamase superfamily II)